MRAKPPSRPTSLLLAVGVLLVAADLLLQIVILYRVDQLQSAVVSAAVDAASLAARQLAPTPQATVSSQPTPSAQAVMPTSLASAQATKIASPEPTPNPSRITVSSNLPNSASFVSAPATVPNGGSIPLTPPKAATATPVPARQAMFTISTEEATNLANSQVGIEGLPLTNAAVQFHPGVVALSGKLASIGPGGLLSGPLLVSAQPYVENQDLHFRVTSITVGGQSVANATLQRQIEIALDDTLLHQLAGQRILSAQVSEGQMSIAYLTQ